MIDIRNSFSGSASALVVENSPVPQPRNTNPQPVPVPRRTIPVVVGAVAKKPTGDSNNTHTNHSNSSSPHADTKFDTAGRRRGFQIGKSLFSIINENSNNISDTERRSSDNSFTSSSSCSNIEKITSEHDLEIENIDMFNQKDKSNKKHKKYSRHLHGTGVEIHDLNQNKKYEEIFSKTASIGNGSLRSNNSVTSLTSMDSIPTFLGNGSIKKWENRENLDGISLDSNTLNWAVGDSDAGMFLMLSFNSYLFSIHFNKISVLVSTTIIFRRAVFFFG